jgi:hypothetical protein
MTPDARAELENVGLRLGATWEAFAIEKTLNELANPEVNASLKPILDSQGAFWNSVLHSLMTTWAIGIFALLDKHSSGSATLYSALRRVQGTNPNPALSSFESRMDEIRDRYAPYRHKIFAHNDKSRSDFIQSFDNANFTWELCEKDILFLDYVWKAVWLANDGNAIPTESKARDYHFAHNDYVDATVEHTKKLLHDLAPVASGTPFPDNIPGQTSH